MSAPGREEVSKGGSSKRAASVRSQGRVRLRPSSGRKGEPFLTVSRPGGPALPPPPTAPPDLRSAEPEGARGHGSRDCSTWVTSHGRARALGTPPAPDHSPPPRTPSSRPMGPREGAGSSSPCSPPGGGRGWGAVPWAESWGAETGDPPERAQPAPGLGLYKRQLVLGMPAPPSNIPTATWDRLHPHMAAQTRRGRC